MYKLIDLKDKWDKIRPHLRNNRSRQALHLGMKAWCADPIPAINRVPVTDPWDARKGPWYYSMHNWWLERGAPERGTVGWYQCYGACHWLAPFACVLAELTWPDIVWRVASGEWHSTVIGDGQWVFDLLLFDEPQYPTAYHIVQYANTSDFYTSTQEIQRLIRKSNEHSSRNLPKDRKPGKEHRGLAASPLPTFTTHR